VRIVQRKLPLPTIQELFPKLKDVEYWFTSCPARYNCVAWALGDNSQWWQAERDYAYWPAGVSTDGSVASYEALFASRGYARCDDASLEPGFEKVAIYTNDLGFRHVTWQHESGMWWSKLGGRYDIEHATLDCLEDDHPMDGYGRARIFMKRPRRCTRACPL
jgi:hypothetical protein